MIRAVLACLAGAIVLGTGTAASCPGPGAKPALRLASTKPVRIVGSRFRPGERVMVALRAKGGGVRRVHANSQGAFTAVFDTQVRDRCSGFFVRAVGNRGSRALLKLPLPACLPARGP